MGGTGSRHRFGRDFQAYTRVHCAEVDSLLTNMLKAGEKDSYLRGQTIASLRGVLCRQFWTTCRSDPNIRHALQNTEKHGSDIVQITQLLRSGDVHLDEQTREVLKPVVSRMRDNMKLVGSIAADQENEAEAVREQAKRSLKGYKMLRSPELDEKIDKVLQKAGD